jgi:sulfonate transport system ATP-binding protein
MGRHRPPAFGPARSTNAILRTIMTATSTLEIRALGKRYPGAPGQRPLPVLDNIDLDIPAGRFVSIVGASGCGKSTLLRLVVGLDSDYQGAILLDGRPVGGPSGDRGIVFQDHRLFPWLTVARNVAVALRNVAISNAEKRLRVEEHLSLVGLRGYEDAYPHQLSGGMAQRVAIARGLVNRPRILLLDEPFGALDALTRSRMQQQLQRIWQQERITMILVTHDVDEAVFLGDEVVIMQPHPGRIHRTVRVDLPHPRDRSDPRFIRLRDDVLSDFTEAEEHAH